MNKKQGPLTDRIGGVIERIVHENPDNGYHVFRVRVVGHSQLVTVVGFTPVGEPGEYLSATGRWIDDRQYGWQFRGEKIDILPPDSLEGIERYLKSGAISGVGAVYAKRLVAQFGTAVLDVIENAPDRLYEVPGMGRSRVASIRASWEAQRQIRDIMVFLHGHGLSSARAFRIHKRYGAEAIPLITENPYRLATDIAGIGFDSADQLARQLNIGPHSPLRVQAAVHHVLTEATTDGHCGLPMDQLLTRTVDLLEVPQDLVEKAIRDGVADGRLVADELDGRHFVFLGWLYMSELRIAKTLLAMQKGRLPWKKLDVAAGIEAFEKVSTLTLSPSQRAAVEAMATSKVLVITGGPGVGKTTLVRAILTVLGIDTSLRMAICAPTGRAARRLSETTGRQAVTIHRLLGASVGTYAFQYDDMNPLPLDVLVVDECSMVDVPLMFALMKALPPTAALLLTGDVDQLPSVGPGRVFADIIESGVVPTVRLTEIFRQALTSDIITAAHQIRQGEVPSFPGRGEKSDCYFIEATTADMAIDKLLTVVDHRIPKVFGANAIRDVQVICPMNRGALGTKVLNSRLQSRLNDKGQPGIERGEMRLFIGDKVMQLENDYEREVFNGDIGFITAIDSTKQQLTIDFDSKPVDYRFNELDAISLAYGVTVHKSQGSEYPIVVFMLSLQHFPMLQRNLVYTALTRGKQLVVLIGQRRALELAVSKDTLPDRYSRLMVFLKG